jgi:hypothetical protein
MSTESENVESQGQEDASATNGAEDLSAALTEGDTSFVSTEKKHQLSTGTLVVGGLIAAAAAMTYFMHLRTGPAKASANPATASADATITQFLSNDSQNAEKMRQLLKDTEKAVQQFQQQPTKTQVPLEELKTNPFRTEFGAAKNEEAEKAAEQKRKDELRTAAASLKVQTIMSGGKRKAAMINGTLKAEGEEVNGFEIEKISSDSVIVRKDGSRFALKMQK